MYLDWLQYIYSCLFHAWRSTNLPKEKSIHSEIQCRPAFNLPAPTDDRLSPSHPAQQSNDMDIPQNSSSTLKEICLKIQSAQIQKKVIYTNQKNPRRPPRKKPQLPLPRSRMILVRPMTNNKSNPQPRYSNIWRQIMRQRLPPFLIS